MTTHDISSQPPREARPWMALLLISLVPLVLGALLAPHILRFLLWLGCHVELGRHFSNPPLRRVVSRTVVVLVLALLYPALKWAGFQGWSDVGWSVEPRRWSRMGEWFAIGVISIALAYIASFAVGALYFRPRSTNLAAMATKWSLLLISAWMIGGIEETFFRGFIFSALRRQFSLITSVAAASLFFSAVHFLRPMEPSDLIPTQWDAGFRLLAHITDGVQRQYAAPMFVNLFLMGVVLCLLFERDRSVYAIAGLHAGWVWMQKIGTYLFDRQIGRWQFLYGNSETISMTWMGTLVLVLFVIVGWWRLSVQAAGECDGTP